MSLVIKYKHIATFIFNFQIQAWPEPVLAWEMDGVTLEGLRYKTEVASTGDPWRWIMRLEIPGVRDHDLRQYSCVAKNELNNQTVKGHIRLMSKFLPYQGWVPVLSGVPINIQFKRYLQTAPQIRRFYGVGLK